MKISFITFDKDNFDEDGRNGGGNSGDEDGGKI